MILRWSTLRRGALGTLAVLMFLGVSVPSASAVTGHRFDQPIGDGDFGGVDGVAVRSGFDLFAVDNVNQSLRRYGLTGGFSNAIDVTPQLAGPSLVTRDPSSGAVYVSGFNADFTAQVLFRYAQNGSAPTQIALGDTASIAGIATSPVNGTLYVADASTNSIRVFAANGTEGTSLTASSVGRLSVDGSGNIYMVQSGTGVVKLDSAGTVLDTIESPTASQVAVRPTANGDVFVVEAPGGLPGITRYNSGGDKQQRFAESASANFTGLAVDGPTGAVFVSNPSSVNGAAAVDRYVEFTAPDVVTDDIDSSGVTTTSAEVTGTVNPRGQANTRYQFQYGTDATVSTGSLPATPTNVGNGNAVVNAGTTIPDLQPNTTYFYRLVGINNNGSNAGETKSFTTVAAPPTVVGGEAASAITPTTASLSATVNANNTDGTARFQYGKTTQYELGETTTAAITGGTDATVTKTISRLEPDTEYHYRVVATNGVEVSAGDTSVEGADQTFTTLPAQPIARADQATSVTSGSAQINGTVDTQGLTGTYSFEVTARNNPYTVTTATRTLDEENGPRAVSETLTGLPVGLTYDVRLRLETSTGVVTSDLATFVTRPDAAPPAPAPAVATNPFPYGCVAPRLAAPRGTLMPGQTVTLAGTDLGVFGSVTFGSSSGYVESYTSTRVKVEVPTKAKGRVAIAVNCGRRSNTVTGRIAPSNRFSASTSVKGSSATVRVKVPGRGAVSVSGRGVGRESASPSKAGTVSLKVGLTESGREALRDARSGRLAVKVAVRYRPSGGTTRTASRTLTFRR